MTAVNLRLTLPVLALAASVVTCADSRADDLPTLAAPAVHDGYTVYEYISGAGRAAADSSVHALKGTYWVGTRIERIGLACLSRTNVLVRMVPVRSAVGFIELPQMGSSSSPIACPVAAAASGVPRAASAAASMP
jgi:hypothetical protein